MLDLLEVVYAVQSRLGRVYDELVRVLLDVGVAPLFLSSDERGRVSAVRERVVDAIREWEAEAPALVASLVARLPAAFQLPDAAQALLDSVPSVNYFAIPESLFEPSAECSPVVSAVSVLQNRWDEDGLISVEGLDAVPHGVVVGDFSLDYHQFPRRGFGSNVHYDLVGTILKVGSRADVVARLALDDRKCRLRHEHEEIFERDYWYGPRVNTSRSTTYGLLARQLAGTQIKDRRWCTRTSPCALAGHATSTSRSSRLKSLYRSP